MKLTKGIGGLILLSVFIFNNTVASVGIKLAAGEAEVLFECAAGTAPEGVAFDRNGNMFYGLRETDGESYVSNAVMKVTPWGEKSILADLGPSVPGMLGVLGLTTDSKGNIYIACASGNESHGVWKICPDGEKHRLPGSEQLYLPNAVTLDAKGNLYCSDSDPFDQSAAGVWRLEKNGDSFEPWCNDPFVRSDPTNPNAGFPAPAANGLAFDPPNHLYVANTEKNLVAHITILSNGSAGPASMIAPIINPDGLAVDTKGSVYVVVPMATVDLPPEMGGPLPPLSPVVRINPQTGIVENILDPVTFPDEEYFDFPTSLAFATGPLNKKSVVVVSMGGVNYIFGPGTGPKFTQVGVGVPGRTGQ